VENLSDKEIKEVQDGLRWRRDMRARRLHALSFVANHAPADDRDLQRLMWAEFELRDLTNVAAAFPDDPEFLAECDERFAECYDGVSAALAAWWPKSSQNKDNA
jgi:hypothetical protein